MKTVRSHRRPRFLCRYHRCATKYKWRHLKSLRDTENERTQSWLQGLLDGTMDIGGLEELPHRFPLIIYVVSCSSSLHNRTKFTCWMFTWVRKETYHGLSEFNWLSPYGDTFLASASRVSDWYVVLLVSRISFLCRLLSAPLYARWRDEAGKDLIQKTELKLDTMGIERETWENLLDAAKSLFTPLLHALSRTDIGTRQFHHESCKYWTNLNKMSESHIASDCSTYCTSRDESSETFKNKWPPWTLPWTVAQCVIWKVDWKLKPIFVPMRWSWTMLDLWTFFLSPRPAYVLKWLFYTASNVWMSRTREASDGQPPKYPILVSALLEICLRRKTCVAKCCWLDNSPPTPPANSSPGRLFTYFVRTLSDLLYTGITLSPVAVRLVPTFPCRDNDPPIPALACTLIFSTVSSYLEQASTIMGNKDRLWLRI